MSKVKPCGSRIPDPGHRIPDTLDPGSRTPDTGSRTPLDSGSRTPDPGHPLDPGSRTPDTGSRIPDTRWIPDTGSRTPVGSRTPDPGHPLELARNHTSSVFVSHSLFRLAFCFAFFRLSVHARSFRPSGQVIRLLLRFLSAFGYCSLFSSFGSSHSPFGFRLTLALFVLRVKSFAFCFAFFRLSVNARSFRLSVQVFRLLFRGLFRYSFHILFVFCSASFPFAFSSPFFVSAFFGGSRRFGFRVVSLSVFIPCFRCWFRVFSQKSTLK